MGAYKHRTANITSGNILSNTFQASKATQLRHDKATTFMFGDKRS